MGAQGWGQEEANLEEHQTRQTRRVPVRDEG